MNAAFYSAIHSLSFRAKVLILILLDFALLFISHIISNLIRDEVIWYFYPYYKYIIIYSVIISFISLFYFDVYKNFLRYTNQNLFFRIFYACFLNCLMLIVFLTYFNFYNFPRSIAIIQPSVFLFILIFSRIVLKNLYINKISQSSKSNIIIYGAGNAGISSIDILNNYNVVALIDDDKIKQGRKYGKIPIISSDEINDYIKKYKVKKLFTALPSINTLNQRDILNELKKYSIEIFNLPDINQISANSISYIDFENIVTNELLERNIYDHNSIKKHYYESKNILITGGGGSIGSEIVLQLVSTNFESLNILDHSEINIYKIKKQLDEYNELKNQQYKIRYYISSINHLNLLEEIIRKNKINIIFHAAAYKHVDLVEDNILSSINNNIVGTYNLCSLADKYKVNKFTFISSDKAVRPTNVMGATKRVAEKIVYFFSLKSKTVFSTVRFGNVINSSGSVIPIFRNQIKNNQKITLTHKDVERYFMTISEAVALVIESCSIAEGGETFFLNMGKRIKIYDLAKKMVKIANPIKYSEEYFKSIIQITGLKKGEKLFEELSINNNILESKNNKIFIDNCNSELNKIDPDEFILKFKNYYNNDHFPNLINLLEENVEDYKYKIN